MSWKEMSMMASIESMKIRQKLFIRPTIAAAMGCIVAASLAANVGADPISVTEITDWNTTPMEGVAVSIPYLQSSALDAYAGINVLLVNDGANSTVEHGFCIDPFHWSGSTYPYELVPLTDAPKPPVPYSAQLNAATATDIEDLWAIYYSPTMSSQSAAGLQVAIWELVSSNAVVNGGLPADEAFSVLGYDYGASGDLASLQDYGGPAANLVAVTGPGQDFVFAAVPDGGETFIMLALTVSALAAARPAIIKSANGLREAKAIAANRCSRAG